MTRTRMAVVGRDGPVCDVRARLRSDLASVAELPCGASAVHQLAHALQAAALAQCAGARPAVVAAALLHDIGWAHAVAAELPGAPHERAGAAYCARLLGKEVGWLVGSHVLAKRVLVATDAGYVGKLSAASRRSLAVQGGPAAAVEVSRFLRHPLAADAMTLRGWDDLATVAGAPTPSLDDLLDVVMATA
ncbi:MAG: HD domain-containing protein [Pseudonocardiaceae bacterium]